MMKNTKIEWADHTFNPWIGCTKISPACDNCYAAVSTPARTKGIQWGAGQPRVRTSPENWKQPLQWNKQAGILQHAWEHGIALHGGNEALCLANGFLKPQRPRVFCASLADVFDNAIDPAWRADLFSLIEKTPHLDWLLLTKRIGNANTMIAAALHVTHHGANDGNIPHNVWLGATICNQEEADRDIQKLLKTPAVKRFLSIEPLLGSVDITPFVGGRAIECRCGFRRDEVGLMGALQKNEKCIHCFKKTTTLPTVDWVIVGGESGHNARPMHPDWVRSLHDQCKAASVPFFFKQWGEWAPGLASYGMEKVGKRFAGRLLNGREYNEVPE
jgi:protein gp37